MGNQELVFKMKHLLISIVLVKIGCCYALTSNQELFPKQIGECNEDALCAIANCSAADAPKLCPRDCTDAKCYADFGFVVDVSGSVVSHWERERSFIKQLAQQIWISPDGGHASVVQFSRDAHLMINFNNHTSLSGFEIALDGLNHWDGTTRIDLGLEVALDQMFQVANGMRPDVTHTLVLITDGNQTGKKLDYVEYRKKLNDRQIRVLVILVGNVNLNNKIRELVNKPSDIYLAKSYDDLISTEFIHNIMLCEDYSEFVDCRDKSSFCESWGKRYCGYSWFTSKKGRYSCRKTCGLC